MLMKTSSIFVFVAHVRCLIKNENYYFLLNLKNFLLFKKKFQKWILYQWVNYILLFFLFIEKKNWMHFFSTKIENLLVWKSWFNTKSTTSSWKRRKFKLSCHIVRVEFLIGVCLCLRIILSIQNSYPFPPINT